MDPSDVWPWENVLDPDAFYDMSKVPKNYEHG